MKICNAINFFLILSLLYSCENKIDLKVDEDFSKTKGETLFYEVDISEFRDSLPLIAQPDANNGICTISSDKSRLIYERTELDMQGIDQCSISYSSCYVAYEIDFSDEEPRLEKLINSELCY